MRLTIDEYSNRFKMSKEMIHSKLKAKKLNYIIEEGNTFIIISEPINENKITTPPSEKNESIATTQAVAKPKITVSTVISLYQKENQQLKAKIVQLEAKIDKLIDDKEQMLRDEMSKIEKLYNVKDEQLRNILELVNAKLMLEREEETIHEIETYTSFEEESYRNTPSELIELITYLKTLDLKSYQRKVIKKRFLEIYGSDVRIIQQNGKLYLDFSKYDYSDLLEY